MKTDEDLERYYLVDLLGWKHQRNFVDFKIFASAVMGAHDFSHHSFHRIRVVLRSNSPAAGLGFYPTDSERKVLNFARECKKLNEQIAATSVCCDAGVKSKLVKRLEQVEKQIRMLNLL